ncbi:alpha/beta hydrolase [Spongiibacter sp.]|uniref:alpha/beta hydrolase n=1 Tax=Spongiibacter sp. TaxID=2024860 RepID=UPI0035697E7F
MAALFLNRCSALLLVLLLTGCEALLFYPQRQLLRDPAAVGLAYREVSIPVADSALHGWWLPAQEPRATLLFAHGNAENISTHLASVYWLPSEGINVLLVDYRGYGRSPGRPSLDNAVADLQASWHWLLAQGDAAPLPLLGFGQSLGASLMGVAVAREREALAGRLKGLVLDAGFADYASIAREQAAKAPLTWLLQLPVAWAMPKGYDLIDALPQLPRAPLLIVHGRQDTVVGVQHAQRLFERAAQPKQLYLYDGGHIGSFHDRLSRQRLLDFIADSLAD